MKLFLFFKVNRYSFQAIHVLFSFLEYLEQPLEVASGQICKFFMLSLIDFVARLAAVRSQQIKLFL